jgi:hypothetical protein
MARPLRLLIAVLAAVAAAGLLTACGGGTSADVDSLLKQTFGPNKPVRSGKLDLHLAIDAKGLKGLTAPVDVKLSGPFQSVGKGQLPKFDFSLSLNTGKTSFSAGAISTSDKGFLKFQGQTYAVSDALFAQFRQGYEQAQSTSKSKNAAPSFQSLGIDPRRWLTDAKKSGEESVGGADTVHITAGIDIGKFLTDVNTLLGKAGSLGQGRVPTSITDQQRKDIESAVKSASLEVWTGKKDTTLRRLKIAVGLEVPADVQKRAGGLQRGTLVFDLLISDLNAAQTITAPANARPLSDLTSALGGAAASGGGGTGATPAPTTTTPPASGSGASQQYLDCLQKAGSNIAAVQKCADLIGG